MTVTIGFHVIDEALIMYTELSNVIAFFMEIFYNKSQIIRPCKRIPTSNWNSSIFQRIQYYTILYLIVYDRNIPQSAMQVIRIMERTLTTHAYTWGYNTSLRADNSFFPDECEMDLVILFRNLFTLNRMCIYIYIAVCVLSLNFVYSFTANSIHSKRWCIIQINNNLQPLNFEMKNYRYIRDPAISTKGFHSYGTFIRDLKISTRNLDRMLGLWRDLFMRVKCAFMELRRSPSFSTPKMLYVRSWRSDETCKLVRTRVVKNETKREIEK